MTDNTLKEVTAVIMRRDGMFGWAAKVDDKIHGRLVSKDEASAIVAGHRFAEFKDIKFNFTGDVVSVPRAPYDRLADYFNTGV